MLLDLLEVRVVVSRPSLTRTVRPQLVHERLPIGLNRYFLFLLVFGSAPVWTVEGVIRIEEVCFLDLPGLHLRLARLNIHSYLVQRVPEYAKF